MMATIAAAAAAAATIMVPEDWQSGFAEGSLQFAVAAPDYRKQHDVLKLSTPLGNGLVGTVVDLDAVYIGGIFNTFGKLKEHPGWRTNSSARAQIPATTSTISLATNATVFAMDARRGVYIARWAALGPDGCLTAERRVYAPRLGAPLLVTELEFNSSCGAAVDVALRSTFNEEMIHTAPDLRLRPVLPPMGLASAQGTKAFAGTTRTAEPRCLGKDEFAGTQTCADADASERQSIAVVYDPPSMSVSVPPGQSTNTFISAYGSSLNHTATPLDQAAVIYRRAQALANAGHLFDAHLRSMEAVWSAELGGASIVVSGGKEPRLARGIWMAMYGLVASMAIEWAGPELEAGHGYSPGGLHSGGIRGVPGENLGDNPDSSAGGNATVSYPVDAGYLGHVFWVRLQDQSPSQMQ